MTVNIHLLTADSGTGASCIYPLLGCAQRPKWKFVGTDIDERSLHYARGNVAYNDLKSRIRLMRSAPDGELIPLNGLGLE
ncbi:MAG: hypothetical protein M1827_001903 [Pycnora praestabilis]|nr:MAG: hypothetical protein M1827_001903 [Pycnora praestabilis]